MWSDFLWLLGQRTGCRLISCTCSIERTGASRLLFDLVSFHESSKGEKRQLPQNVPRPRHFPHFCLLVEVRSNCFSTLVIENTFMSLSTSASTYRTAFCCLVGSCSLTCFKLLFSSSPLANGDWRVLVILRWIISLEQNKIKILYLSRLTQYRAFFGSMNFG